MGVVPRRIRPRPHPVAARSAAPETWLDTHGDALFRYAFLRVRDRDAAEDLVQETLLAALQAQRNFAGGSSERTWLVGILKHKLADHWRRSGRETMPESPAGADDPDELLELLFDAENGDHWRTPPSPWLKPDAALEQRQFWEVLAACIDALPPAQAQAFALCEIDGATGAEACKVLDVTPTNLWVMLHRARLRLRQCLEIHWFADGSKA
jgi:RNA polymerase sigma-70 factor (ECF subfamily)